MILSRRKAHLFSSIALAVVLPLLFLAGLIFRPTYGPVNPEAETLFGAAESPSLTVQQPPIVTEPNPIAAFLQR